MLAILRKRPEIIEEEVKKEFSSFNLLDDSELERIRSILLEDMPSEKAAEVDNAVMKIKSNDLSGLDELVKLVARYEFNKIAKKVEEAKKDCLPARRIVELIKLSPKALKLAIQIAEGKELKTLVSDAIIGMKLLGFPVSADHHGSQGDLKIYSGLQLGALAIENVDKVIVPKQIIDFDNYFLLYPALASVAIKDRDIKILEAIDKLRKDETLSLLLDLLDLLGVKFSPLYARGLE